VGNGLVFDVLYIAVLAGYIAAIAYPAWRILKRLGYGSDVMPMMVLGSVLAPLLMLWVVALNAWPVLDKLES
jgi:hypothetical protein